MMMPNVLPFQVEINPVTVSGASLWAVALYLGFHGVSEWVIAQLQRWFDFAERWIYLSSEEYERTRSAREAQNAFWASIFSIVPFLIVGTLCYYGCLLGLGNQSWAISLAMIAVIGVGVYELGRRDSESGN